MRTLLVFLGLWMAAGRLVFAGDAGTGGIVVIDLVGVPSNIVKQVVSIVPGNLFCPVRVVQFPQTFDGDMIKAVDTLEGLLSRQDVAIIALANVPGELAFRDIVASKRHVAILNIAPLKPGKETPPEQADAVWATRVEKQITAFVSYAAGMSPCPFPLCARYMCATLAELDAKGRNACPPCQMAIEKLMHKKGTYLAPRGGMPLVFPEDK